MPRLVAVLCALLVVSGCAGADLAKHKPYPRSTIQANAEKVTETTGATPTDTPSGQPVDPAFAPDKLRLTDPCKLLDREVLAQFGKPGEVSPTGFSRCSNYMADKNGKDLAVSVEIGQTMATELKKADKQLAGLKSYEQTLDSSACFVSVITQERPPLGLTVQIGYQDGDACGPGRKVAESVVGLLKARAGAQSPPKDSLVRLDPCALVDQSAVAAAVGPASRMFPYGLHTCSWVADAKEVSLDLRSTFVPPDRRFDAKQTEVDLGGGVTGYQLANTGAYPSCTVQWVQRMNTGEEGELVAVKSAGQKKAEFDRCATAVAFAKAVLPKIPKG
ncbi:hypothetical protein [Saccharothrix australiensis]|uniref:DUF3558 domain-containing protein n=1 Tax=Saccharothrix australiensis TaxID=2072 RepID=A0A495WBR1_9PSEU|nr:hypothetical protein [Saccharothrix australiensis]RKT57258.1 hypothetical protein C8E97_5976 [Saccharothrix australiensis]